MFDHGFNIPLFADPMVEGAVGTSHSAKIESNRSIANLINAMAIEYTTLLCIVPPYKGCG